MLGEDGDATARCMNFMVSSREDMAFGCLLGCAMSLHVLLLKMFVADKSAKYFREVMKHVGSFPRPYFCR